MSSTSSTSALFTPLQFTGVSQFSTDFQSILSRAVSIAQLPVTQLQNQETSIAQQETDLTTLGSAVSAVGSALKTLGSLGTSGSLSATSSDTSVVTATSTGASSSATSYSITNVTSLATAASENSKTAYRDSTSTAVSTTGTMQLTVGSHTYPISLTSSTNNLSGLKDAINASGAPVTASILTTSSGNYLSVSATATGSTTLKLVDDPSGTATGFLTATNQGTNTNFTLNGIAVSEAGTTVNDVIPGISLDFKGTSTTNETVTVSNSTDRSQISSALQTLVSAYNTLATDEGSYMGTNAGSLGGNSIIYQIRQAMSSIVQYQGGTGGMTNLANLGIEMDVSGQMSFNSTTFSGLSDSQISSSLSLLGTSTTGLGGLQNSFTAITDSSTGTIAEQEAQWKTTTTRLQDQISTKITQIQAMEQTLNLQLAAADTSIANLASQQNTLTASIKSLDFTSYGYNDTNTSSSS
jgi:flagellar hook-associated protein 2